jgi:hypothetical protein
LKFLSKTSIHELVSTHFKRIYTIIIPGFGALTITKAATGEIMFMPYLKFDGGKFDQLYIVSISSHSSQVEANNQLNEAKAISANAWIIRFP